MDRTNRIQRSSIFGCALLLGLLFNSGRAQETPLRWRFSVGDELNWTIVQDTSVDSEFDLAKQKITTESALRSRWTVVDVNAQGTAEIDMQVLSARMKILMPTPNGVQILEVDSAVAGDYDQQEQEMLANLQSLIGNPIRIVISPRGELKEVRLSEQTKEAIRKSPQAVQMRLLLSDDGLQELLGQAVPPLPESETVSAGQMWTVSKDFAGPAGRFTRQQEFTARGSEPSASGPLEKIDFTARLVPIASDSAAAGEPNRSNITIQQQSNSGTFWFDSAAGYLVRSEATLQLQTESIYREKPISVRLTSHIQLTVERK